MLSFSFNLPKEVSFSSRFFTDSFSGLSSFQSILLSGPLGSLSFFCPSSFSFSFDPNDPLTLFVHAPSSFSPILFRSFISLFLNSLTGITSGFTLSLSLSGVGFKASLLSDHLLELSIGFSHPVLVSIPSFIHLSCPNPSSISASSFHLPLLSSFLHSVRLIRPSSADPFKGKGLALLS